METNKPMQQVIISTSVRLTSEASVAAYKALPWWDLPEDDMEYNEVTRFIVGYQRIILFGKNGRRLATFQRRDVQGMAVDGKPVIIRGKNFKRIGVGPSEDSAITDSADTDATDADATAPAAETEDAAQ